MDIRDHIIQEWAKAETPLPVLVTGEGATQVVLDVMASRAGSLYLDSVVTISGVVELGTWATRKASEWVGIGIALDRITADRSTQRLLGSWMSESLRLLGLALSWERSGSLDAVWIPVAGHCVVYRLTADPEGPALLPEGIKADVSRAGVVTVLAGLARKDHELLERALHNWGPLEIQALKVWMSEAITGQWSEFTVADSSGMHTNKRFLMRLMKEIDVNSNPRILAKSLFLPMVL